MRDPAVSFVLVLLIGVVAGVLYDRFGGPGWLSRQIAGPMRGVVTSALVGVAGAFIGFHIAGLISLTGVAAFIAAAVGAAVVLFAWRMVR